MYDDGCDAFVEDAPFNLPEDTLRLIETHVRAPERCRRMFRRWRRRMCRTVLLRCIVCNDPVLISRTRTALVGGRGWRVYNEYLGVFTDTCANPNLTTLTNISGVDHCDVYDLPADDGWMVDNRCPSVLHRNGKYWMNSYTQMKMLRTYFLCGSVPFCIHCDHMSRRMRFALRKWIAETRGLYTA